ncbi:MAG TPA: helix-turn-helix domain-containing protein [Isosphaeraceae bacterium]|nr:helix-turn-helix domain-containing protein [Isosphaeraceae bacterium]
MAVKTDKRAQVGPKKSRSTGLSKYIARVRNFPLEPIRNEAHLTDAQAVLDSLLQEDLDAEGEMYLGALTQLVEAYEKEHEPALDVSEADVLRELMRANGLTQKALEEKVGISQSTISAVLHGTRSLTRKQVLALSKHFLVHPSAFLPFSPRT